MLKMNINNEIKKSLKQFKDKTHFVIAVSGGPDSQCLLAAFAHVNKGFHDITVIGCDHGFRKESASELDLSEELAKSLGLKFIRIELNLEKGPNTHARARDARYSAMRHEMAKIGAKYLVTAHHYDDRAETVLIRLMRGRGLGSLGVLRELNGDLYRPLLNVTRTDIMGYINRWGIKYATDPSNNDTKYLRAKVRNEILPLLEESCPSIRKRLNDIADEALSL